MKTDIQNSCLVFALVLFAGCGGGPSDEALFAEANATNVQRAATLYSVFQGQHAWVGPKDEAELIEFAKTLPADKLKLIGVTGSVEDVLKGRDGQPLKYRFAIKATPRDNPKPIVFESSATEGKYQVGFTASVMKEVDQAEYDRLLGGSGDEDLPVDPQRGKG